MIQLSYIFGIHFLTNSMMNIINLSFIDDSSNQYLDTISKIFLILCLLKIFINVYFVVRIKDNFEKVKMYVNYSYAIQTLLLIFLIYLLLYALNRDNSIILLLNNILFIFGDIGFRFIIEYKLINRVIPNE